MKFCGPGNIPGPRNIGWSVIHMVFASPVFLFAFMPVVVLLCIIARAAGKAAVRNVLLLLFSLLF